MDNTVIITLHRYDYLQFDTLSSFFCNFDTLKTGLTKRIVKIIESINQHSIWQRLKRMKILTF
jgi:hypothetical protein